MGFGLGSILGGVGKSLAGGIGMGLAGSVLGGLFGGGKKKKKNPYQQYQQMLLGQLMPLVTDPGAAVAQGQQQMYSDASRYGGALGSLLAEQTGNPNVAAAVLQYNRNRATESGNQMAASALSPLGRAQTAATLAPIFGGAYGQSLQSRELGLQYRQPTALESVIGAGANALPYWLDQSTRGHGYGDGYNINSSGLNVRGNAAVNALRFL